MKKQTGLSLVTLLVACVVVVIVALGAMKIAPAYIEYAQIKKATAAIIESGDARGTVADIRRSFDRRAQIDDISSITAQDLDITKDGGEVVISFAYPKKVALFSNVSLLIEFAGTTGKQ